MESFTITSLYARAAILAAVFVVAIMYPHWLLYVLIGVCWIELKAHAAGVVAQTVYDGMDDEARETVDRIVENLLRREDDVRISDGKGCSSEG
jgi:hypothetical protein